MKCRTFQATVPRFLKDTLTDRGLTSFWEHGVGCSGDCAYRLMHKLIKQEAPLLLEASAIANRIQLHKQTIDQPISYKRALKEARLLKVKIVRKLILRWGLAPARLGLLVIYLAELVDEYQHRGLLQ